MPGTRNGIRGLHQLPLPLLNTSLCFGLLPSSLLLPCLCRGPPRPQGLLAEVQRQTLYCWAWGEGGGWSTSITSNNLSYFLEHHTGNDTSWPVTCVQMAYKQQFQALATGQDWVMLGR